MTQPDAKTTKSVSNQGVVAHESLPTGRTFAQLRVNRSALVAHTEAGIAVELPLDGLKLSWGGANNKLLFLSHPLYPGWSIFTRDRSLLSELQAAGVSGVSQEIASLWRQSNRSFRQSIILLSLVGLIVWSLITCWRPIVATSAGFIPFAWEKKLGEAVFLGIKTQTTLVSNEDLQRELTTLLQPLTQAVGDMGGELEFYIAKSEDLNAFALPGGKIVINSRAILDAARVEELYGVIAHEIAHVSLRHTTQQLLTVFGVYTVADLLLGNVFGTVAAVTQGATYLLQQGFSRDQERQADEQGLTYLHSARIDPRGMVEFFERIQSEYSNKSPLPELEKSLSFLSTHPATADRITGLSTLIEAASSGTPSQRFNAANFEALKKRVKAALYSE